MADKVLSAIQVRSEPQLGGQRHPEGRSGAEDGGAGGHHPGTPGARIPRHRQPDVRTNVLGHRPPA